MASRLRSVALLVAALLLTVPRLASAQEPAAQPSIQQIPRVSFAFPGASAGSTLRDDATPPSVEHSGKSAILTSLYATTALMQGLDVHSTMTAIHAGAVERNPAMSYLTGHPAAFVAMKSAAAAGLIY